MIKGALIGKESVRDEHKSSSHKTETTIPTRARAFKNKRIRWTGIGRIGLMWTSFECWKHAFVDKEREREREREREGEKDTHTHTLYRTVEAEEGEEKETERQAKESSWREKIEIFCCHGFKKKYKTPSLRGPQPFSSVLSSTHRCQTVSVNMRQWQKATAADHRLTKKTMTSWKFCFLGTKLGF